MKWRIYKFDGCWHLSHGHARWRYPYGVRFESFFAWAKDWMARTTIYEALP